MRYLMMVMGDADYEAGKPPSEKLQQAMGDYMGKSFADGSLVQAGGLKPSRFASRVKCSDGDISVTDGPFAEAKEIIGGFAFMEASDDATAQQMAREFIQVHIDAGVRDVEVVIRQVFT